MRVYCFLLTRYLFLLLCLVASAVFAAPGDILYQNQFSNNGDVNSDWSRSGGNGNDFQASTETFNSSPRSLRIRDSVQGTSNSGLINASAVGGVDVSFWLRQGNPGSAPESGEDLEFYYIDNTGTWRLLETYLGSDPSGTVYTDTFSLPNDALHSNLRFRFNMVSGGNFDRWYVDDFLVVETAGSTPVLPNPVGFWQLEEGNWSGAPNEVIDISGNGLHGRTESVTSLPVSEFINPAIVGSPGTCGYGNFQGPNSGFIRVADNPLLDMSGSFSLSTWIWPRSLPSGGNLLTFASKDTNYEVHVNSAGQIFWWWGGGSDRSLTTTGTPITASRVDSNGDPEWYHVVITFSVGEQKIYIDGVERASLNSNQTGDLNNRDFFIGADYSFNSRIFDGYVDEVGLYDQALTQSQVQLLMAQTHDCPITGVDHYAISFDGGASFSDSTGLSCEAASVTLIAHDASDDPIAPGAGTTVSLSTSSGEGYWSNPSTGTLVDNGGGNASYTFDSNDTVTLQFNHTTASVVNIDVDGGSEGAGEDPNIEFFDTGFRFVDGSDNRIGLGEANEFHQISAVESGNFFLQAIRTDNDTGSCVGVFADGDDVAIRLGAECNNPLTCAGEQLQVTNNSITTVLATSDDNGGVGAANYTDITLRFGADSKAALTMEYPDAGAVSLHAQYDILNDDGTDSGADMIGSSSGIVFKPDDLVITVIESNGAPATSNPATTTGSPGFLPAATAFRIVVEARNADNNRTPNFGNETTPEGIVINFDSLVYPAGGVDGAISAADVFSATATAGAFENTAISWSEVGTFRAYASIADDGDYLGAGDVTGTTSGNIGRFYPASIQLSGESVDNSCISGGYSYFSEPDIDVSYTLEARNASGNRVLNYDNNDIAYNTGNVIYAAEDNDDGTDLSARLNNLDALVWDDGIASFSDTTVSFERDIDAMSGNRLTDGPFTQLHIGIVIDSSSTLDNENISGLDMHPGEADDTSNCVIANNCTYKMIGNTLDARFGRLFTRDTHGPESAPLKVPFQTEYWTNGQFVINTSDSCTRIARTDIAFDTETIDINLDAPVGAGTTTGSFANLDATHITMSAGDAELLFSAPNTSGSFPLDVDLTLMPWLRFDWNQNGDHGDDAQLPAATVSFGHYRGHDRIIYWQEQFR